VLDIPANEEGIAFPHFSTTVTQVKLCLLDSAAVFELSCLVLQELQMELGCFSNDGGSLREEKQIR